ncbi:MAG: hypothetical protein MI922_23610 [Bacteroidales bacterium]|nr:hypothetical protein [Bacteroidales bacterium]
MTKVLICSGICSTDTIGNLNRILFISQKLRNGGYDVSIRGSKALKNYLEPYNFDVFTGFEPGAFGTPKKFSKSIFKLLEKFSVKSPVIKSPVQVMKFKGLLSPGYMQKTYDQQVELLNKIKPDVIVSDWDTVIPMVAKKLNYPLYIISAYTFSKDFRSSLFSEKDQVFPEETKVLNKFLSSKDLPLIQDARQMFYEYHSDKVFVNNITELDDLDRNNPKNVFMGLLNVSNERKDWDFINSIPKHKKLLYVYLSFSGISPKMYKQIITETFKDSDEFEVIVSTGKNRYFKEPELHIGSVHFFSYVPQNVQLTLLQRADVAIHHGGQNITIECILNEIPAIAFADNAFERHYNASKAANLGCLVQAPDSDFNPETLRKYVREVASNDEMKKNCIEYGNKLLNAGGAQRIIQEIENLAN